MTKKRDDYVVSDILEESMREFLKNDDGPYQDYDQMYEDENYLFEAIDDVNFEEEKTWHEISLLQKSQTQDRQNGGYFEAETSTNNN